MHVHRRPDVFTSMERLGMFVELVEDIADALLRHPLRGEKGRHALDSFPCFEQRCDLGWPELDDARAPVALDDDQPFLLELPDRFSHRRSADAVFLAQLSLVQAFAWVDLSANDVISKPFSDARLALDFGGMTTRDGHGSHR